MAALQTLQCLVCDGVHALKTRRSILLSPLCAAIMLTAGLTAVLAAVLAACGGTDEAPRVAEGTRTVLALLETTDLHTNVQSYDYFKLAEDKSFGFERVATLIKADRKSVV